MINSKFLRCMVIHAQLISISVIADDIDISSHDFIVESGGVETNKRTLHTSLEHAINSVIECESEVCTSVIHQPKITVTVGSSKSRCINNQPNFTLYWNQEQGAIPAVKYEVEYTGNSETKTRYSTTKSIELDMPPGTYSMRVRSISANGEVSEYTEISSEVKI